MKICNSQRDAILLARTGRTTLWIRDYRKESDTPDDSDEDRRVGYIYSMDREILKKLAIILAPDVTDEPTIEVDKKNHLLPEEHKLPLLLKVCGEPLMNAMEFTEM